MKYTVKARKIGNSQGFVLPKQFDLHLDEEYLVTKEDDTIIITPKLKKKNIYKGHAPFSLYTEDLIDDQAGEELL